MGSKFCNLNLRGPVGPDRLEALLPGVRAFPWENGWTTLTSPCLQWGQTQKYAAVLSEETGCPVLSTEYFDDDYVELAVYRAGKRASRHVPASYEDLRRSRGCPDKFLTALEWNMAEAPRLKKVFQVEDPEESVCLLESLLGCPIFEVDEDSPPAGVPGGEAIRIFAGEESPVKVSVSPRKGDKGRPPYAFTLEKEPSHAGIFDTVFCYTDRPEKVSERLNALLRRAEPGPWKQRIKVRSKDNLLVIQEYPMVNVDIDLPDLSREFKCLVAACRVVAKGVDQVRVTVRGEDRVLLPGMEQKAELHCGLAYGRKLLCFGRRGAEPRYNKIMPEISLESPWIVLPPGALVSAFERPGFWEAAAELGRLLGCPLCAEGWEGSLVKDL